MPEDNERPYTERLCTCLTYEEITQIEFTSVGLERLFERSVSEYLTQFGDEAPSFEDYCAWIVNTAACARDDQGYRGD